jgi:hypothetical protein
MQSDNSHIFMCTLWDYTSHASLVPVALMLFIVALSTTYDDYVICMRNHCFVSGCHHSASV